jgi:hypothetical protein
MYFFLTEEKEKIDVESFPLIERIEMQHGMRARIAFLSMSIE